jgi:hypothetical protein
MGEHADTAMPIVHKVARQVVNPIAPPPVRIVLEPALQSRDQFFLEPNRETKPTSGGVKFGPVSTRTKAGKTHTVIEFDQIRDATIYKLVHYRGSSGKGDAERDVIESQFSGSKLTHPQWKTPGPPNTRIPETHASTTPPPHTPPRVHDELLKEDSTDFPKIRVDEPKLEGKS